MSTDPFILLGLPRRPWLDDAAIRAAFQKRSRRCHPDAPGGDTGAFAELNAAHAAVSQPAERLKLLLDGGPLPSTPPDVDFAFRIGSVFRLVDEVAGKQRVASNPIARAMLAPEVAVMRGQLDVAEEELGRLEAAAVDRLESLDAAWPETEGLAGLAATFVFLARWRSQLRERRQALM
jgi:curved DNA-binding protein CbpA